MYGNFLSLWLMHFIFYISLCQLQDAVIYTIYVYIYIHTYIYIDTDIYVDTDIDTYILCLHVQIFTYI